MDDADDDCPEADLPSCTGCRKRKLKCSRQKPSCSNCERLQISCLYDGRRNKPGLRGGVVDSLSQRLERVEQTVFGGQHQPPFSDRERSDVHDHAVHRDGDGDSGDALNHATGDGNPRKRARAPTVIDDVAPGSGLQGGSRSYLDDLFTVPGYPTYPEHVLEEMMEDMLDLYFTRIQPWVPMLHELSMRSSINDPAIRGKLMVILRAMTVASLRFLEVEGRRLGQRHVEALTRKLKDKVLLEAMTGMHMQNRQAFPGLEARGKAHADHDVQIGDGNMSAAWPLIGSLTRTVEHLELSTEAEDRPGRPAALFSDPAALSAPKDWLEEEERRRVFWNVFILDRWNTSLTAADVSRRLPVDGGKWYLNEPSLTPYFGIWDRSTAKIGKSIAFLPAHYPSARHDRGGSGPAKRNLPAGQIDPGPTVDNMCNVGAVGYYIESIESLSQITTYFLQTKVNFSDPKEVSDWLTRFKELDLRLVHWKMYLPQQWKDSGVSRQVMPGVMDPNMTIANATHNVSMILLHQRIAYPTADLRGLRLPSDFSADTCSNAAIETACIIQKYLSGLSPDKPVSPQMGICAFVSAKALLVHHQHYKTQLPDDFQLILQSLEDMHRHWRVRSKANVKVSAMSKGAPPSSHNWRSGSTSSDGTHVGPSPRDYYHTGGQAATPPQWPAQAAALVTGGSVSISAPEPAVDTQGPGRAAAASHYDSAHHSWAAPGSGNDAALYSHQQQRGQDPHDVAQLSAISQILMDDTFLGMDRIISFDDMMNPDDIGSSM
ncbi:hypothetical protein Micbo1qcDRAFT_196682 [Microdochium bolleyi]|uniref:Zn(2)-C6 fungal-type domain-containing protein n=1 Tax=Microdochium bolleyi TaxID=196109 RepID=A0A136IWK4_9PEZI|nr:hypothetical protein Micbo1qcDRAFT_196682 [Microdochium bolleyi]